MNVSVRVKDSVLRLRNEETAMRDFLGVNVWFRNRITENSAFLERPKAGVLMAGADPPSLTLRVSPYHNTHFHTPLLQTAYTLHSILLNPTSLPM